MTQGVRYDRIGLPTWGEIQQQQTHTRTSLTLISHLLVAGQGQDEGKARDERSSCTGCHVPPRCSCMCPESYLLQEEYCLCPFPPSPPLRPVATHVIIMCGWVYSEFPCVSACLWVLFDSARQLNEQMSWRHCCTFSILETHE